MTVPNEAVLRKDAAAGFPRRRLRRAAGAAVIAALAILVALEARLDAAPPSRAAGELDAPGLKALVAARTREGKVVLVNFWATWCVPCREEFPDLVRLQKELGPRGLSIVGVSTDFASQTAGVERFLAETRPNFPNYRKKSGGDDQAFIESVDPVWGGELPFTVLYGRDGNKARVLKGKHTLAEYRGEVTKLLATR